jgi:hypothetical protein
MASNPATSAMTPIGTLCFVDSLFSPKPRQQGSDKLAYSVIIGFDANATKTQQYQDLRAAVSAAAADKWGAIKAADAAFMRTLRLPFRNASEKDYAGFDQFEIFISPWSPGDKKAPGIVDLNGNDITIPTDVWSGQLGRATVRAFAYDNSGNKGVAFMLEHVQIVKADMPRIDGRRSAQQAFEGADDAQAQLAAMGLTASAPKGAGANLDDMPF